METDIIETARRFLDVSLSDHTPMSKIFPDVTEAMKTILADCDRLTGTIHDAKGEDWK